MANTVHHQPRCEGGLDKHFGWYDGNPATLHPLPRVEAGKRFVEYMGGADAILEKVQKDYDKGDYRPPQIVLQMMAHPTAGTHAGAGRDHRTATEPVERHGLGCLPGKMQTRQNGYFLDLWRNFCWAISAPDPPPKTAPFPTFE